MQTVNDPENSLENVTNSFDAMIRQLKLMPYLNLLPDFVLKFIVTTGLAVNY